MPSPENDLTGIWHGLFTYPAGPSVPFMATLIESASRFSGATHEACSSSQCSVPEHNAFLAGRRHGGSVTFEKTYDPPTGGFQTVHYDGALSSDGNEIEGRWIVPGAGSGKFLMIRSTKNEVATERAKMVKA